MVAVIASTSGLVLNFPMLNAFFALELIGGVGCLAVLLTGCFSHNIPRYSTWYSLLVSWILSSVYYSLLLLTGQYGVLDPPFALCLLQSTLIYSAPVIEASTSVALTFHVWLDTRHIASLGEGNQYKWSTMMMLLSFPYVLHVAIFLEALITGIRNPSSVRLDDSGMYCGIVNGIPGKISSGVVILLMVIAVIFQGVIVTQLYRHWRAYPSLRPTIRKLVNTFGRVTALSLLCITAMCFGFLWFVHLRTNSFAMVNLALSILPVVTALLFGTQRDIIDVWMFWTRRKGYGGRKEFPQPPQYIARAQTADV